MDADNEGAFDRAFRIVLGLVLMSLMFFGPHAWWGMFGVIPLVTGIVGYCPLYRVLHVNTCHRAT
jgi:hypothetical protein